MIHAAFFSSGGQLTGFRISGHSDYSEQGSDIVCAAVSSAAYMTANTVTEILALEPALEVGEGDMLLKLSADDADRAADILRGLRLHIEGLQEQFPQFIHLTITEV